MILHRISLLLLLTCAAGRLIAGQSPGTDIGALLKQMTVEEKIALVHGALDPNGLGQAGYWPGLPRLGIPPLRIVDGPVGVNVDKDATGMPAPVGLAATFDTEAARLYGVVMGRDAKALGQDILLAPYINIVRDPLFRRNHTTLGEDPLLNARIGVAEVLGVQSQGVMAQVKHLAAYNGADNVFIDERTLHEIYLPAFEASVKAGAASVMCAYNKVNGHWSCANSDIQNGVLRGLWGFQGFVTSDWGAVHSTLDIADGVDLEMPGRMILGRGGPYFTDELRAAVEKDLVPVSAIDQAASRILYEMDRFHLLNGKPPVRPSVDVEADAKIVREIAEQGAVLLKNEGNALPLSAGDLASLAVIGPTGGQLASGFMGERAYGFESRLVSPLAALRKLAPGAKIAYSVGNDLTGVPISGPALSYDGKPGLLRKETSGGTGATVLDQTMDFQGPAALEPGTAYAWTGTLTVPSEGDYTFMVQTASGNGSAGVGEVLVDGSSAVRSGGFRGFGGTGKKWSSLLPTADGRDNSRGMLHLSKGAHQIDINASSTGTRPLNIRFSWMTPELRRANIDAAVAVASAARTAVVFAWSETGSSLALQEDQDVLIRRVAAANPRSIVVLNTGGPVIMPWNENVRAILEMWYPGQEGGWATADLADGPVKRLDSLFGAPREQVAGRLEQEHQPLEALQKRVVQFPCYARALLDALLDARVEFAVYPMEAKAVREPCQQNQRRDPNGPELPCVPPGRQHANREGQSWFAPAAAAVFRLDPETILRRRQGRVGYDPVSCRCFVPVRLQSFQSIPKAGPGGAGEAKRREFEREDVLRV